MEYFCLFRFTVHGLHKVKSSLSNSFIHNWFGSCNRPQIIVPDVLIREGNNLLNKHVPVSLSFKWQSRESRQRQSNAQKCVYGCLGTKLPHLLQTKTGISLVVGGKMRARLDFFHLKIEGEISRKQTYALSHGESWASGISWGFSGPGQVQLQPKVSFKISHSMA